MSVGSLDGMGPDTALRQFLHGTAYRNLRNVARLPCDVGLVAITWVPVIFEVQLPTGSEAKLECGRMHRLTARRRRMGNI
jgi:hypothetical protein